MIRYALKCSQGHDFESWFQSAAAYEKLSDAGMISCSTCGDGSVKKALMAPPVSAPGEVEAQKDSQRGDLTAPKSDREKAIAALRQKVEANSDYVGLSFAAEARAMHDGDTPHRAIHGEAKPEDARKLIEDGVPVAPLPFLPTRKAN
ncbi:DUF1178 family protein [Chachezhania antarctica]|uniref:DUF1178 family protein n=1 Tax=Chachezhania antarctica TaxID=2340860 RepID=UPI000EB1F341|nr:DUF1178 family protein [Chachezhania antarctica]|tara:strand:- start:6295 stop:6735 length:441 start_codon:yes stop_codon:yes gene_type:complete